MKHRYLAKIIACCCSGWIFASLAGSITIVKSSEVSPDSPDPWQIKQQILLENQWREWIKTEQGINLLYQLPIGCAVLNGPQPRHFSFPVYNCFGRFYRPYSWQNQDVFVEVTPPETSQSEVSPYVMPDKEASQNREKGSNKP